MKLLNGWKEIAACLHRTPKSAQRWERLGLPVRRLSNSSRSPVVAFDHEIENWIRNKNEGCSSLSANTERFRATRRETQLLVEELRQTRAEFRRRLSVLKHQIGLPAVSAANTLS